MRLIFWPSGTAAALFLITLSAAAHHSRGQKKHLVESFELNPDRTSLTYRFELEDPEYLTAPVIGQLQLAHRPDLDFTPVACDLENARRFLEG
jgi:hypothetical protein